MTDTFAILDYMRRRCLTPAALAQAAGLTGERLRALIAARCLPGPTYVLDPSLTVRSAIRSEALAQPEEWFGGAVAPWARRAAEATLPLPELAAQFRQAFAADFRHALLASEGRRFGWTELFDAAGTIDEAAFAKALDEIWEENWLGGAYAVCLRRFDGRHLVTKLVERSRIRALTEEGGKPSLTPAEAEQVTAAMARLDAVLTPFAPHERPHGTPGLWIDRIAERYDLPHPTAPARDPAPVDSAAAAA
ncbi:DUF6058 family natural product biosynthesis protein [Inquilinus limosus]|uniref:Uncharacterized protein n=1 Tax=Inquilinus limosus TaxID=171674 RepID=A0A211ZMS3_9PROT|nr:DUF6058 family natural product biosynthesis protein [Inquilinus limosus]OWJ66575.1 hypothetical protein BWR60_13835 [Inquilinus limosus]